jgi:hypothetical protein
MNSDDNDSRDDNQSLMERLKIYRRRLDHNLSRRAILGDAYSPHDVILDIQEAREEISHLKSVLRDRGILIEDHPDDEDFRLTLSKEIPNEREASSTKQNIPEDMQNQQDLLDGIIEDSSIDTNNPNNVEHASGLEHDLENTISEYKEQTSYLEPDLEASYTIFKEIPKDADHLLNRGKRYVIENNSFTIECDFPFAFGGVEFRIYPKPEGLQRIVITLTSPIIIGSLMVGLHSGIASGCRLFIDVVGDNCYEVILGQICLQLTAQETTDLCKCIDIACSHYKEIIISAEQILDTSSLLTAPQKLQNSRNEMLYGFYLMRIHKDLWQYIRYFVSEFDYDKGEGNWNIFDGGWNTETIRISGKKGMGFPDHAFIQAEDGVNYSFENQVVLFYIVPEWLLETIDKVWHGWENNIGIKGIWSGSFIQTWTLKRLIPKVLKHYSLDSTLGEAFLIRPTLYDMSRPEISDFISKISILDIPEFSLLREYFAQIYYWILRMPNIETKHLIGFFNAFISFIEQSKPSDVDIGYISGKIYIIERSYSDDEELLNQQYLITDRNMDDVINYLNSLFQRLEKKDYIDVGYSDLIMRIFIAIARGKHTNYSQARFNILKREMAKLYELVNFDLRFVLPFITR